MPALVARNRMELAVCYAQHQRYGEAELELVAAQPELEKLDDHALTARCLQLQLMCQCQLGRHVDERATSEEALKNCTRNNLHDMAREIRDTLAQCPAYYPVYHSMHSDPASLDLSTPS